MRSRRLILVRHGRVDFSSRDFRETPRGRQWDPALDDTGREQAAHLAARLSATPPVAVSVSPFRRCAETLAPFAERSGVRADVVDAIGEVFVGAWEGVPFEELVAQNEDFIRRRIHEHEAIFAQAPGAERGAELRARVVPAIEGMLDAAPGDGDVLVVTHGGVINAYMGHVLGVDQDMFFLPENCSLNVVEAQGAERRVKFLSDTAHLFFPRLWESAG